MQKKFLGFSVATAVIFLLINWGCTKIDSTSLGGDLIPAVDNVNTFDTIINIQGTQGLFNDTTRLGRSENYLVGSITNDPVFGKTNATIFLELKPTFFPYFFGNAKDTILEPPTPATGFDSAYLFLSFKAFYGDTTVPQHLQVFQLANNTTNFKDSVHFLNFIPDGNPVYGPLLGEATITPKDLRNKTFYGLNNRDSSVNVIRIPLNTPDGLAFLQALGNRDSTRTNSDAFVSDSLFKTFYKGFAIVSDDAAGGNGLFYTNLADAATRLEVHYRKKNSTKLDTTFSNLYFSVGTSSQVSPSAHANNIKRDRVTGNPEYPNTQQADALYIQSVPGTFASLKIPGLDTFKNSVIHRAEILVEQIPGNTAIDNALTPPRFLYLDLKDTGSATRYKTIYYDLNPTSFYEPDNSSFFYPSSSGIDFNYFGGFLRYKNDAFGKRIAYYDFNISRYVQNMVTKRGVNYNLRLYAPYNLNYYNSVFGFPNSSLSLGYGQIKIANGNNPNYKLSLRIIYSKI